MSKPVRLFSLWAPPVALMALIFALSAMPTGVEERAWWELVLRKLAHFGEYALLCALLVRALGGRIALAWMLSVLYAVTDEYHQTFVDGRFGTPRDVAIDAAGALTAALVIRWLGAQSQPRSVASSTA